MLGGGGRGEGEGKRRGGRRKEGRPHHLKIMFLN